MLEVKKLNLELNKKKILENISFNVGESDIFNILGPNGSGKTSLLKSIIGLYELDGEIIFKGENIEKLKVAQRAKLGINYIMQEIPEYTGILIETYMKGILKDKFDLDKVKKLFLDFGLDYEIYKTRYFDSHLSGGERKKVEIITSFLLDKDLYLLDEIEVSLDATSREVLVKLILEYQKQGKSFLIVSHSRDILELASRGILLCNGKLDKHGKNNDLLKKYFENCDSCKDKILCN